MSTGTPSGAEKRGLSGGAGAAPANAGDSAAASPAPVPGGPGGPPMMRGPNGQLIPMTPQQMAMMAAQQQAQQASLAIQNDKKLMHNAIMSRFALLLHDPATIAKLFEEGDYDVDHQNPPPLTFPPLLGVVCMTGNTKILDLLLEKKPNLGIAFNLQRRRVTLLHVAMLFGFTNVVKKLVEAGMKPLVLGTPDKMQGAELPLFTACATGNADLVRYFVEDLGAETAIMANYQVPPGQPVPPVLQSMPRDALYACCVGLRPYLADVMDLVEVVLSRAIEGVQGISIPKEAFPAWPRGTEPAVLAVNDSLDGSVTTYRPNYKATMALLVDRYGIGGVNAEPLASADAPATLKDPFPAAKWHDYARVACQHANREAVEFFLERGLLNTPLPKHVASSPGGPAAPALAVLSDVKDAKQEQIRQSVLGVGLLGSLAYPLTTLEALHSFTVRVASRPPNTFRLLHMLPGAAFLTRSILNLPSDVANISAMVARHAGAAAKANATAPELSLGYTQALKAQCVHVTMFLTNVAKQRPQAAPHYEPENKGKTLDAFIIAHAEAAANRFAVSLSALQEYAAKDPQAADVLEGAAKEYQRVIKESEGDIDIDEDERAFLRLLDPKEPMSQERFTAICFAISSNQRGSGKEGDKDSSEAKQRRYRKAAWGHEPVYCKATSKSSSSGSSSSGTGESSSGIDPDHYPLSRAYRMPGMEDSNSASASGASAGAGGSASAKKAAGGGGLLKSALSLVKEAAAVVGSDGDSSSSSSDEFSKIVARQVVVREAKQHTADLLYYYRRPQDLSLAASIYQAAEDVCSPDFWGAPPPASAVKGERAEVNIDDIPMPEGAAADYLLKTVTKALKAGYEHGPYFAEPTKATSTAASAGAAAAKAAGSAAASAGAGSAASSSAASVASASSGAADDADEDDLLLQAMGGTPLKGKADGSKTKAADAGGKAAAGATAAGGAAGAAAAGRGGVCGGDAWFPASLAAAAVAAAWIVASGWLNAAANAT